jgi:hypothetical protein
MNSNKPSQSPDTNDAKKPDSAADASARKAGAAELPEGGKLIPPSSPVDVPRMPAPAPHADLPDLSDPHGHASSWADSTDVDPHKKSVRTSINNG